MNSRNWLPVIPVLYGLLGLGYSVLMPQQAIRWLLPLTLALMLGLNQVLWWRVIVPIYYQAFLD